MHCQAPSHGGATHWKTFVQTSPRAQLSSLDPLHSSPMRPPPQPTIVSAPRANAESRSRFMPRSQSRGRAHAVTATRARNDSLPPTSAPATTQKSDAKLRRLLARWDGAASRRPTMSGASSIDWRTRKAPAWCSLRMQATRRRRTLTFVLLLGEAPFEGVVRLHLFADPSAARRAWRSGDARERRTEAQRRRDVDAGHPLTPAR